MTAHITPAMLLIIEAQYPENEVVQGICQIIRAAWGERDEARSKYDALRQAVQRIVDLNPDGANHRELKRVMDELESW